MQPDIAMVQRWLTKQIDSGVYSPKQAEAFRLVSRQAPERGVQSTLNRAALAILRGRDLAHKPVGNAEVETLAALMRCEVFPEA